jgi:hypothetical protein
MEPDRYPRNQECEDHYEQVRVDPRQHFSRICHAGEIRRNIDRVRREQGHDEDTK